MSGNNCLSRNGSNWLRLKKVKEKLFEKTLIGFRAAGDAYCRKNGQGIKAGTEVKKAKSESV